MHNGGHPIVPLVIHRSEWERLKNQANLNMELEKAPNKVDIEAMNAQSRKWTSSWPDSVQARVNKLKMKNKKVHLAEMAEIEAFHKRKKQKNTAENLRRARDMIFQRTCYGKELLSALFESKILEEREILIKFKKEIQEKEKEIEEAKIKVDNIMYAEFEKGEHKRLLQKQKEKSDAECNRMMAEMKKEETIRAAEIEKKNRLEDAAMIEKLRQLQVSEKKHDHCVDKEADKIYEEQNKAIKAMREKRETLDQVLADVWCRHQDRIRCKEKQVFDQIHKEKQNTGHFKENYELVQRLQEEAEKKYNNFIDKGVKRMEKRLQKKEKEEKQQKRDLLRSSQISNKEFTPSNTSCMGDREKCDRQCFFRAERSQFESKAKLLKEAPSPPRAQFPAPPTALQAALRRRRALPGGWSGAEAAHAQFARHATAALHEAKHKHLVRKVIHNYKKQNNLKDLQIPN